MTSAELRKYDRSDMRSALLSFPDQFRKGLAIGRAVKLGRARANQVVVAGMGGSSFPIDIVNLHLGPLPVKLEVVRDYKIRVPLDGRSLVLVSSFSGSTEETLSALDQATAAGAKVIAITAGRKLGEAAEAAGCPVARIEVDPESFQPRFAYGYFFSIYAGILEKANLLNLKGSGIDQRDAFLGKRIPLLDHSGRRIAEKLVGQIPLVYTSERYAQSVARITKIKFNENSKAPAFWNSFPELNHNEMQGFEFDRHRFHYLFLNDPKDDPRIHKRMAILRRQLRKKGYPVTRYDFCGSNELERAFDGLVLGDWASYYLALLRKKDPTPVDFIEAFKVEMKKR